MSSFNASCPRTDPLLADLFRSDPARVLRDLRQSDPVHFVKEIGAWVVSRHDLVRRMMSDENVSNDPRTYEHHRAAPAGSAMRLTQERGLMAIAPDDHARIRRLVLKALTNRAVRRMEQQIRDVVQQYSEPLRGRTGVVDLYAEYFEPIPNTVISRILGVPALGEEEAHFRQLAKRYLGIVDPLLGEEETILLEDAIQKMHAWLRRLIDDGRSGIGEGLISDLVAARDTHGILNDDEIIAVVSSVIAAGTDTIVEGGVFGLRSLFQDPAQMQRLRRDRDLLPKAVDELLRYDFGPGDWMPRYARRDFELEGREIRAGQLLLLSFTGAHRDPAAFPDPDRLDFDRDNRALLVFGHGPHYCLGAGLARTELAIILDAALDVLPVGSRLLADRIEWRRTGALTTRIGNLPVDFGPACPCRTSRTYKPGEASLNWERLAHLRERFGGARETRIHDAKLRKELFAIARSRRGRQVGWAFCGPPTLLDAPFDPALSAVDLALVGIPTDLGVTNRPGARLGPRAVRGIERIGPYHHTHGFSPETRIRIADVGDVPFRNPGDADSCRADIEAFTARVMDAGAMPLSVGGDHSVTYPILRALGRERPLGLIHIDAHCDTGGPIAGMRHHHGSTFRDAVLAGSIDPERTIQIGIRGPSELLWEFSRASGMTVVPMEEAIALGPGVLAERARSVVGDGPVYLSFDVDSLDPAFAPGTGTPEAGGFAPREVMSLLRSLAGLAFVGADVVELSPAHDTGHVTALNAAQILFDLACLMTVARTRSAIPQV